MTRLKVCVSFDYENDKNSRNAIRLWNANKNIDFSINDKTPTEIDTYRIDRIKAGLSACYHFDHDFEDIEVKENALVLLENCLKHKRKKYMNSLHKDRIAIGSINWQNWECKKALELNKKIILVKLNSTSAIPEELYGESRIDVNGLELEKIKNAFDSIYVH